MAFYKTPPMEASVGGQSTLSVILDHFLAWDVTMTSASYVEGRYVVETAADLSSEQIEHLELEAV